MSLAQELTKLKEMVNYKPMSYRESPINNLSEQGSDVLLKADAEAKRFNHNYIGTEHILLGLVYDPSAQLVLNGLGVDIAKVRGAIEWIVGRGDKVSTKIGLTPRSKYVLELAWAECQINNAPAITPLYILRGLVREGEGIAAGVL